MCNEHNNKIKCEICEREFSTLNGLSTHIRIHKITSFEYYEKFLKKENYGICLNYGKIDICKKNTNWVNMVVGYHEYCSIDCMIKSEKFKEGISKRSGENHWLKKSGVIHPNKDKTYEEIHGEEKAQDLKKQLSDVGKTLIGPKNPFYGHDHSEENKEKFRENKLGKTYEEMYGIEKASEIKAKISENQPKTKIKIVPWKKDSGSYTEKFYNKEFRIKILKDQDHLCAMCKNH